MQVMLWEAAAHCTSLGMTLLSVENLQMLTTHYDLLLRTIAVH